MLQFRGGEWLRKHRKLGGQTTRTKTALWELLPVFYQNVPVPWMAVHLSSPTQSLPDIAGASWIDWSGWNACLLAPLPARARESHCRGARSSCPWHLHRWRHHKPHPKWCRSGEQPPRNQDYFALAQCPEGCRVKRHSPLCCWFATNRNVPHTPSSPLEVWENLWAHEGQRNSPVLRWKSKDLDSPIEFAPLHAPPLHAIGGQRDQMPRLLQWS